MSTTTDAEQVTLSAYASGRVRELLADHVELNGRIDTALAGGMLTRELLDDREAIDARIVTVLLSDMTASGQLA